MAKGRTEGLAEGKMEGLKALINSLRPFIKDANELYKAVIANESYSDVSYESFKDLYDKLNG